MAALPTPLVVIICVVLGLAVGSFLNVVIHRVPLGVSVVRPGSRCPACQAPIRARHNLPVIGWLLLRGRCADCAAPISARYPAVELGTAVAFGWLGGAFATSAALPAVLWLAAAGIALSLIDIDVRRLPDAVVRPSAVAVAGLLLGATAVTGTWDAMGRAVVGALATYGFFRALRAAWPGGLGGGDGKLAGLLGLVTGWLGWGPLVVGLGAGFLLAAAYGVALVMTGRGGRRTAIPFGPFLVAGAFVGLLAGAPLASAYLDLLAGGGLP